ncbi:MAG: hypothetical protein K1X94_08295 [Sandaracinaceae bacterium]|nr:hypothetical protein [Sandaracinaceae bacterium]
MRGRIRHDLAFALASAVAVLALHTGAASQRPSACVTQCRSSEQRAREACHGDTSCTDRAVFTSRRCALACDRSMSEGARCRAQCAIESDECDASCRAMHDDGEQRGCLRRCGSRYHLSCPRECPP